jgi:hypothetical protein
MHYRIVLPQNPSVRPLLMETLRALASDKEMQKDRWRLERARSAPEKFIKLQDAPVPSIVHDL